MSSCVACQQPLENGVCTNTECEKFQSGSLVPDDPNALIDHTGTIDPQRDFDNETGYVSREVETSVPVSDQTMLANDDFFNEIAGYFNAENISVEGGDDDAERKSLQPAKPGREMTFTLQTRNRDEEPARQEFVIPIRDVEIPTDSATIGKKLEEGEVDESDYRILSKLGEGAGGVVYQAEQRALKRSVAIKVLKERKRKKGKETDARTEEIEKRRTKFYHEAMLTARLEHPNIVPIHDIGINPIGSQFYSMKLIDENSWAESIRDPDIERNIQVFMDVCDALRYSHEMDIIHRDLKPENVMLGEFGEVFVVDWGLAVDKAESPSGFTAGGTPCYMPPEMANHFLKQVQINSKLAEIERYKADGGNGSQARNLQKTVDELRQEEFELSKTVGKTSDVYLLGAMLYEIAVGHPPHLVPGSACKSIHDKHRREFWLAAKGKMQVFREVKDPLRQSLRTIALKAMSFNLADRYQNVGELQDAIRGYQDQLQSIKLTDRGYDDLMRARQGEGYQHLLPALESFREANRLWPQNERATRMQVEAASLYAERADNRKDFDAGLSILDDYTSAPHVANQHEVVELRERLELGQRRRRRQRSILVATSAAAVLIPIVIGTVGYFLSMKAIEQGTAQAKADAAAEIETFQGEAAKFEQQANQAQNKVSGLARQQTLAEAKTKLAETRSSFGEYRQARSGLAADIAQVESQETRLVTLQNQVSNALQSQLDKIREDRTEVAGLLSSMGESVDSAKTDLETELGQVAPEIREQVVELEKNITQQVGTQAEAFNEVSTRFSELAEYDASSLLQLKDSIEQELSATRTLLDDNNGVLASTETDFSELEQEIESELERLGKLDVEIQQVINANETVAEDELKDLDEQLAQANVSAEKLQRLLDSIAAIERRQLDNKPLIDNFLNSANSLENSRRSVKETLDARQAKIDEFQAEAGSLQDALLTLSNRISAFSSQVGEKVAQLNEQIAKQSAKDAEKLVAQETQRAEKLRFNSEIGQIASVQASLPGLINTNRLDEANRSLRSIWSAPEVGEINRQLVLGWDLLHLGKRTNPGGWSYDFDDPAIGAENQVHHILERRDGSYLVIIDELSGAAQRWKIVRLQSTFDPAAIAADVTELPLEIPVNARIADASLLETQASGNWLALALEGTDGAPLDQQPIRIFNLDNGKQGYQPAVQNESILGCKLVRLFETTPGNLELITIAEEAFDRQTTDRVELTIQRLSVESSDEGRYLRDVDNGLDTESLTLYEQAQLGPDARFVSARINFEGETRDDSRVEYIATARRFGSQTLTAVAAETLGSDARPQFSLQLKAGDEQIIAATLPELPTAIELDGQQNIWCGFSNGLIKGYRAGDGRLEDVQSLSEHSTPVIGIKFVEGDADRAPLMMSGSRDGVVIAWEPTVNEQWQLSKKLLGHPGELACVFASARVTLTGDLAGTLRSWQADTTIHDPFFEPAVDAQVTCAAIDRGLGDGQDAAVAVGTEDGRVLVYRSGSNAEGLAPTVLDSPFVAFDSTFRDFNGIGRVGDTMVLIDRNGVMNSWNIAGGQRRPSRLALAPNKTRIDLIRRGYRPVLATIPGTEFLVCNSPAVEGQLLLLRKVETGFQIVDELRPEILSNSDFAIRSITVSPNGKWLALMTKDRARKSEVFVGALGRGETVQLPQSFQELTDLPIRVDDPAFLGFDEDSQQLAFSFFTGGDRQTSVETFQLAGNQFTLEGEPRQLSVDEEMTVIDWTFRGENTFFLCKKNKDLSLRGAGTVREFNMESTGSPVSSRGGVVFDSGRKIAVLTEDQGLVFYEIGSSSNELPEQIAFERPRGMRRWDKNHILVLDALGFHLLNLNAAVKGEPAKQLLVEATVRVSEVDLVGDVLAVSYDNGESMVYRMEGDQFVRLGDLENGLSVRTGSISPDGTKLQVFGAGSIKTMAIADTLEEISARDVAANFVSTWRADGAGGFDLAIAESDAGTVRWSTISGEALTDLPTEIAADRILLAAEFGNLSDEYLFVLEGLPGSNIGMARIWSTINMDWVDSNQELTGTQASAMSVSQIAAGPEATDVATRLVLLAKSGESSQEPVVFMMAGKDSEQPELAADLPADAAQQELPKRVYQVREIKNILNDLRDERIIKVGFSGDGRSLLRALPDSVRVLLSNDPETTLGANNAAE